MLQDCTTPNVEKCHSLLPALYLVFAIGLVFTSSLNLSAQQTGPLVTNTVNDSDRVTLPNNVHPLARAEYDQGSAPDGLSLSRILLVLRRSQQQESSLRSLLQEQQDRHSPMFRKWLTPQEFGARFGATDSDIAAVTGWMGSKGFTVTRISASRMFIEFSGTAGQVKEAFQTPIHRYAVEGHSYWANVLNPTIPAALAPVVAGINSLNSFPRVPQYTRAAHDGNLSPNSDLASPMFTATGQFTDYLVSPYDFATIYDLLPLWQASPAIDGNGQTIAIVSRSDVDPANAPAFWSLFGLDGTHMSEPILVRTFDGPNPGVTTDEIEADIDTQWSGAVAPGATINLVVSASTETTDGVDLSALYIVDNNLAPIMSESYGQCEKAMGASGVQFYGTLWEQAAAQGISVFVSTGDNGAAGCDSPQSAAEQGLNVNGVASTPFNAAVGGTDFNEYNTWTSYWSTTNDSTTSASALGYIPETSWNDSCSNLLLQYLPSGTTDAEANCNNSNFADFQISAGGAGGSSASWMKPEWQTGTPSDNARDLPDVSLFASNGFLGSSYVICQTASQGGCFLWTLTEIGGTSVSAPAFAGIMALVDQKTGSPQGDPALILYKLSAHQPSDFHDIPAGTTIAMPCATGSPNCTTSVSGDKLGITSGYNTETGYDLATGIGSVDAAKLVDTWNSISFTPSTTTLSLNGGNAVSAVHGSPVPVNITVNQSEATGVASLIASPGQPGAGIADFALTNGAFSGSTSLLPGGSYSVMAHYDGDGNYGGSYSNSVPVIISAENSITLPHLVTIDVTGKITSDSASSATYGDGFPLFRVDVGDAGASVSSSGVSSHCASKTSNCPTGTVTLHAPGTALDSVVLNLNSEGYAEVQTLTPGSYSLTASYSGDASYAASTGTVNFTIAQAPTTTTSGGQSDSTTYGADFQIAADVATTSTGVAPTGNFQFYVDGQAAGAPQPVYESYGYQPGNTATPFAWADAQTTYAFLSLGTHTLSAAYLGDSNYAPSSSSTESITVAQSSSFFNDWGWGVPGGNATLGQQTTMTALLIGSEEGAAPTGTITFYNNGTAISGNVTYTSSAGKPGVSSFLSASMPYTFTSAGSQALIVSYSGDANYQPTEVTSSPIVNVAGPITVSAGTITIASPGQSGSTTVTVTPSNGFTGTVTLTCLIPATAAETNCGFGSGSTMTNTTQVTISGSAATATLTVTTTAPHQVATLTRWTSTGLVVAVLLAVFVPRKRLPRSLWLSALAAILILGQTSCGSGASNGGGGGGGGGTNDPGTPTGTYSFTVSASSGSGTSAFTNSAEITVSVM